MHLQGTNHVCVLNTQIIKYLLQVLLDVYQTATPHFFLANMVPVLFVLHDLFRKHGVLTLFPFLQAILSLRSFPSTAIGLPQSWYAGLSNETLNKFSQCCEKLDHRLRIQNQTLCLVRIHYGKEKRKCQISQQLGVYLPHFFKASSSGTT